MTVMGTNSRQAISAKDQILLLRDYVYQVI